MKSVQILIQRKYCTMPTFLTSESYIDVEKAISVYLERLVLRLKYESLIYLNGF